MSWKHSYSYDENNNRIESFYQEWENGILVYEWKYSSSYDENNNRIESFYQEWEEGILVLWWKYSYSYDDNNNRIVYLRQEWDGANWLNAWKSSYSYDDNNNWIDILSQRWDGEQWVASARSTATHTAKSLKKSLAGIFYLSQNYPNPFNINSTIEYRILKSAFVKLNIYNSLGQKVATLVNKNQAAGTYVEQWDASGFASGSYFFMLVMDNRFLKTRKMVLLK